ncbi:MAG: hypothetical protein GY820_20025 [Gammaproteobacteria bacterium]|nr:hypothetical protein [Gammaproteobacteria bacterium]
MMGLTVVRAGKSPFFPWHNKEKNKEEDEKEKKKKKKKEENNFEIYVRVNIILLSEPISLQFSQVIGIY